MHEIEPNEFPFDLVKQVQRELKNPKLLQMAKNVTGKEDTLEIEFEICKLYTTVYKNECSSDFDLPRLLVRELSRMALAACLVSHSENRKDLDESFRLNKK